jgi:hypothetical protein
MHPKIRGIVLCFVSWFTLVCASDLLYGQSPTAQKTPTPVEQVETDYNKTLATLEGIIQSKATFQEKLKEKEKELRTADTEEQKTKIVNEMNEFTARLEALGRDFEGIATGIELESFTARPRKKFDWKEEIQDVLGPIIEELKKVTARPREIEKLRNEVTYYEKRLPMVENAIKHVKLLKEQATTKTLKNQLDALEKKWTEKEQEIVNQVAIAQYHLDERLKEKKPVVESVQHVVRVFFKSRGKNLVLALLAFVVIFLLLHFLHRLIYKLSPIHKVKERSFYIRLSDVIYHMLTFVGATIALLIMLYISGDWVLLGLALIFLFGIAWTAKQGLPLFWEQIKLLLNLSTVREGERVLYNGLPWHVRSLSFYTKLHNPALKGGLIRLPVRKLIGLQSRPFHKDEPWFPCQENDWIILADGTFGKVLMQTPEMVQLVLLGGSRKTYPTTEFLQQNPNNLSTNFRIEVTFGIDYQHQRISTQEIPQKLQTMLQEELSKKGYKDALLHLNVEFQKAGSSSLDLAILADFSGNVAKDYDILSRILQRIAVDACNTYGWVIPFTQITLHTAESSPQKKEDSTKFQKGKRSQKRKTETVL